MSRFLFFLMRVSFVKNVITDNILSLARLLSLSLAFFSSSRIHSFQWSFSLPPQTGTHSLAERSSQHAEFRSSRCSENGVGSYLFRNAGVGVGLAHGRRCPSLLEIPLVGEQTMKIYFAKQRISRVVSHGELESALHSQTNPVGWKTTMRKRDLEKRISRSYLLTQVETTHLNGEILCLSLSECFYGPSERRVSRTP